VTRGIRRVPLAAYPPVFLRVHSNTLASRGLQPARSFGIRVLGRTFTRRTAERVKDRCAPFQRALNDGRAFAVVSILAALVIRPAPDAYARDPALDATPKRSANGPADALDPDFELLRETQKTFRDVAAAMTPHLVKIETVGGAQPGGFLPTSDDEEGSEDRPPPSNQFRDDMGSSFVVADGPTTGIVYSADGYIITSSFNFVRDPLLITVTLSDGRRFAADLIARDQVRKIALLKVQAADLKVPEWADPADVRVGQWAVALGLGFGGERPSLTVGIVSALHRMLGNAIQTDAKLSPANYGGPLCDVFGRVMGITVPMAQRPGELAGVEMYDSGVGFAVPKAKVDEIVAALQEGRSLYRGWLGIQLNGRAPGVVIGKLADPSPMKSAGAQPGDRIVEANGKPVKHFGHLVQALYMIPAGERVHLKIDRDESSYEVDVTLARNTELGPLPQDEPEPFDPSLPKPE